MYQISKTKVAKIQFMYNSSVEMFEITIIMSIKINVITLVKKLQNYFLNSRTICYTLFTC